MEETIDAVIAHLRSLPGNSVIASSDELLQKFVGMQIPKPEPKPVPKPQPKPIPVAAPPPKPKVEPQPKPAPAPPKKQVELQLPTLPEPQTKSAIGQFFSALFPHMKLHDEPPSDTSAKRVKEAWKEQLGTPDIAILSSDPRAESFLKNVARAIDCTFAPCRVITVHHLERENKWDLFLETPHLKWVICPDSALWSSKNLLPFFKEYPKQNTRFLSKVPLLLLPDVTLYLKNPELKRSLWTLLCQTLSQKSS